MRGWTDGDDTDTGKSEVNGNLMPREGNSLTFQEEWYSCRLKQEIFMNESSAMIMMMLLSFDAMR